MIWTILGIEKTKDKKAIKKAYRNLLSGVNPEEKPEEFMELRAAYEEALRQADLEEEEVIPDEELTPVQLWSRDLEALYDDLKRRTDLACWKELFSREVCSGLDTRVEIEEALLLFLSRKYRLPHEIWLYLDELFSFSLRTGELYEAYPADFIDYVILNGIRHADTLPLELFSPGENGEAADEYCKLYYEMLRAPFEESDDIYRKANALPERHPYGDAIMFRCVLETERTEEQKEQAFAGLKALCTVYPDNDHLLIDFGFACLTMGHYAEGGEICDHVLEHAPDNVTLIRLRSELYAKEEKYEQAVEQISQAMTRAGGNSHLIYELEQMQNQWNEKLFAKYEKELEEDPENHRTRFELAWCWLRKGDYSKAYELAGKLPEGQPDLFGYYNLLSLLEEEVADKEKALSLLETLGRVILELKPDGTAKTKERMGRYPETLVRRATLLNRLGREKEAESLFDQALELSPRDATLLTHMTSEALQRKKYQRASELGLRLTQIFPESYHGFLFYGIANFELSRDNIAFQALNKAQELEAGDLQVYLYKLRILVRNQAPEPAQELIGFLKENGITDHPILLWCEAQLLSQEEEKEDEVVAIYREIARSIEGREDELNWLPSFYYDYAIATANANDKKGDYSRECLYEILDRGLALDPDHMDSLDFKGWLLRKDKKSKEALEIFQKLEQMPHRGLSIEKNLAELYYEDLNSNADRSLHYYQMLLDAEPENDDWQFYVGMCKYYMGDLSGAEAHFLKEQELAPDTMDGYFRLARVYSMDPSGEHLSEALDQIDKTLDIVRGWKEKRSTYWLEKVRILRRRKEPYEAAGCAREIGAYVPDYQETEKLLFEIFTQFGLWEEARAVLDEWKQRDKGAKEKWGPLTVRLHLLQKELIKARIALMKYRSVMSEEEQSQADCILELSHGNLKALETRWKEKLVAAKKSGQEEFSSELANYAKALWFNGRYQEARTYAEEGLAMAEKALSKFETNIPIYLAKKALCYAILGREEEARYALYQMRSVPMCSMCSYPSCKDADVYEAEIELILGHPALANAKVLCGQTDWPDEENLIELEYILKKGL